MVKNTEESETALDMLPIGMAYVPMQKWQKIYDGDVAFKRGTVFGELDMPFLGEEAFL
ncbi:MAG: spore coat associated protein CotJA [Oscillospiraceae bacterium]|jgi:hypothetical protein|nr:spore coat associated protein CotJA [Oscillospiraceae bacterium]